MRALIYARVSIDRQGRSLTEQEHECREWATREGWDVVEVITEAGSASRYARSTSSRQRWDDLTAAIASGRINLLLTWEASRATRQLSEYAVHPSLDQLPDVRCAHPYLLPGTSVPRMPTRWQTAWALAKRTGRAPRHAHYIPVIPPKTWGLYGTWAPDVLTSAGTATHSDVTKHWTPRQGMWLPMDKPKRTPPQEIWMELADRKKLAKLMVIQEVSQRELALAAGWRSHSYMGRLLRGEVKTLDARPALLIAKRLGCGVDDLFLVKTSRDSRHNDALGRTA